MQIDEVIIGHAGNIVHYDLVGLVCAVGNSVVAAHGIDVVDMVGVDGGIFIAPLQILQHLAVDLPHHGLNGPVELGLLRGILVDLGVVVDLCCLQCGKVRIIQLDAGFAVAVFDDVYNQIVDDL